jgi:hypothetical protein
VRLSVLLAALAPFGCTRFVPDDIAEPGPDVVDGGEDAGPDDTAAADAAATDAAEVRTSLTGFDTCTIATTCGPSPEAGPCDGTWTLDGTGRLTCPNSSRPPVEISAADLLSFNQLITSDLVSYTVVEGGKCVLDASPSMLVVIALRKNGRTSVREVMSCAADWQPWLLAQLSALDEKYCRGAP